jgi:cell volume regulation protein A
VYLLLWDSFKSNSRSKLFISWVGLRGSVPIVFATYPLLAGIPKAELIFNLVFFYFYLFCSVTRNNPFVVAKLLHVTIPPKAKRRIGLDFELTDNIKSEMREIILTENSKSVGKKNSRTYNRPYYKHSGY